MSTKALGLIETIGLAAAIEAADAATKAANVTLLGYENSKGGGMITVKVVGDVGAVKAAIAAGSAAAARIGRVASTNIIARPHTEIEPLIHSLTRGKGVAAPAKKAPAKSAPKPKATPAKPAPKPKTSRPKKAAKPAPPKPEPAQPEPTEPPAPAAGTETPGEQA